MIAAIITLWALVTIVFFLVRLMPGDPFYQCKLTKEVAANMRSYYGFDKPLIQQYFTYLANLLHGNFGYSMKYTNKTVNYIIGQTFPYSADLGIRALVMAVSFGLVLGIIAARNRGKKLDFFCVIIAIIGTSIPDFTWEQFYSISLELNGDSSLWQSIWDSDTPILPATAWRSTRWLLCRELCDPVCWK